MSVEQAQNTAQMLLIATFEVAGTLCGIDAMKVQEVVRVGEVTPVHHAPKHIVGVINLRGKIVTVIDLGVALEMRRLTTGPLSRIFIVEYNGEYLGLLADSAGDVVSAATEQITAPPANIHGVQGRFFEGVYQASHRLIAILNVNAVLGEQENG